MLKLVAVTRLLRPLADRVEHVTVNLNGLVAQGWMVERSEDIVRDFVDRNTGILPCIKDSSAK